MTTQKNASAPVVTLASGAAYQPFTEAIAALAYGNGLVEAAAYTLEGRFGALSVSDGGAALLQRSYVRSDNTNITGIADGVIPANSQSFWYTPANRLQNASGPWGALTWAYDGVGVSCSRYRFAI